MTKEEAKELLPIIQAYAEGKPIQLLGLGGQWTDVDYELDFNSKISYYRIKPEPKLRPYKSSEFIEALKKHGCFMFVIGSGECHYSVQYFDGTAIKVNDKMFTYDEVLKTFTWADDNSLCGIMEE